MVKILYIFRSPKAGPSIRRVFEPIGKQISIELEVQNVFLPFYKMIDFWKNIKYIRSIIKYTSYDIIHVTGDVYYLLMPLYFFKGRRKYKTVVTVHDLGHYTQHKHSFMHFVYYWLWIKPIKLADYITFISTKSLEEGNRLLKLDRNKVSVINNPYNEEYVYTPVAHNNPPIILHIGTGPNKNLENVIKALKGIPCHLRIIKRLCDSQIKLLDEYNIDYSNMYDLSDEQMLEEYRKCDIVSFPSLYEGFGMPIIEGQAVGRVVVTSNREPMKGIAGDGAILVDPENVDDIRNGFKTAMANPDKYIEKGLDNCKRFSATAIAKQYNEIYLKLNKIL